MSTHSRDGAPGHALRLGLGAMLLASGATALAACGGETSAAANRRAVESPRGDRSEVEILRTRVLAVHPHDPRSYTQGLLWWNGRVYESRGRHGESGVFAYRLETGERLAEHALETELFGEGLARVGDELVQVTWQAGLAIVYDETLVELRRQRFRGEGWGLTFDGESLILSDGTHVLSFLDPRDLRVRRRLPVRLRGIPRDRLNELEWVDGAVWANVYETDEIVRVDPQTGDVTAVVDASGLLDRTQAPRAEVLNGIAHLGDRGSFLLTGKYWPSSFEVVFEPAAP
ncbi:MAG TPA: glutaminyl-peptide cyclotransferase [Thermoanaerobaculia bacterium]|nr:glutaminyl-peptide cyclotransferase [Thermoanaerobaculia bacterium]